MSKFALKQFIQKSIDGGYVKTKQESLGILLETIGQSFANKLREQKVKIESDGTCKASICGSWKTDRVALYFKGRWFEVNLNIELEDAGLDPFYYTLITDSEQIDSYNELKNKKPKANKEDLTLQYAFRDPKELLN